MMKRSDIPRNQNGPILDENPRPAFAIAPVEIIYSIKQQFTHKELALRELGQNSQDADATQIRVNYRYEIQAMIIEFIDDGFGMTQDDFIKHYLRLFYSSKEAQEEKVGRWSLGRLSLLCYEPESIEVFSLAHDGSAHRLEISSDLSGRLFETDPDALSALLKSRHGTMVRMKFHVGSEEEYLEHVNKANECLEKELCWIRPELTTTTVEKKENSLVHGTRKINRPLLVPGKYSMNFTVDMSSGLGRVRIALGIANSQTKDLAPLTLAMGGIPIERPQGLAFTSREPFCLRGMHIILDSFSFNTNIGRNVVYRETDFLKDFLPKFFQNIVLDRFVKILAGIYTDPNSRLRAEDGVIEEVLADVCIKSDAAGYQIPKEVLDAPIVPGYGTHRSYSLSCLDQSSGPIYVTYERPSVLDFREAAGMEGNIVCICLADLPYGFQTFLNNRYRNRVFRKEGIVCVSDEQDEDLIRLSRIMRESLRPYHSGGHGNLEGEFFESGLHFAANDVSVARLRFFNGATAIHPSAIWVDKGSRGYFNYNNPHVRNLIDLILKPEQNLVRLAGFYLMRELLFSPGLEYSMTEREQLLTLDLQYRFHGVMALEGLLPFLAEAMGDEDEISFPESEHLSF